MVAAAVVASVMVVMVTVLELVMVVVKATMAVMVVVVRATMIAIMMMMAMSAALALTGGQGDGRLSFEVGLSGRRRQGGAAELTACCLARSTVARRTWRP